MGSQVTRWHQWAQLSLLEWDDCSADCDVMTAMISHHLREVGVAHRCFQGGVQQQDTGSLVVPHFWIELPDGFFIDLRLRKWLGEKPDVPHGVFHPQNYPNCGYAGQPVEDIGFDLDMLHALSDWTLDQLELPRVFDC